MHCSIIPCYFFFIISVDGYLGNVQQQSKRISSLPVTLSLSEDKTRTSSANFNVLLSRAYDISSVSTALAIPLLISAFHSTLAGEFSLFNGGDDAWDKYWKAKAIDTDISNSERVVKALEELGPTYVKFGQALACRPDIIPISLAEALCKLQDDMKPFDTVTAKEIIMSELLPCIDDTKRLQDFLNSLSDVPVAAASVGQVYKGFLNGNPVAVKVQRPGVRRMVEKDAALFAKIALFVESIPSPLIWFQGGKSKSAVPGGDMNQKQSRLINTELVSAVEEFMSRLFEELDYKNEANNAILFAKLYSVKNGIARDSMPNKEGVIVPEIIPDMCTENVIVMEWIEGTKLTSGEVLGDNEGENLNENLVLIKQALYVTLSQLLDTGVMHADPHGGNLLKVTQQVEVDGKLKSNLKHKNYLAYLDFGLLATIPSDVRDALVCAVAQLVFAKDVDAVARLFGELDLLPKEVMDDQVERLALTKALTKTMDEVLQFPEEETLYSSTLKGSGIDIVDSTTVPILRFDKLLDGLTRLIPRFKFQLPPYFINNARALGTLEGIARSLDPKFNCLQLMYPYALNRMMQNSNRSPVVAKTLQSLIRNKMTKRVERKRVSKLLKDSALFSGFSKRRVLWDIIRTNGGKRLTISILWEELCYLFFPKRFFRSSSLFLKL